MKKRITTMLLLGVPIFCFAASKTMEDFKNTVGKGLGVVMVLIAACCVAKIGHIIITRDSRENPFMEILWLGVGACAAILVGVLFSAVGMDGAVPEPNFK